jgi:ABC-2 type transport system ATP-binding protein
MATAPAIEVRNVSKGFRIPTERATTLRERVTHPLRRRTHRELHVLDEISFEVHRGEFFGIVGRNGSGKSTLLKLIASIYKADAGTIRVAGRLAPFIELGVGFHPEQTAYDNVVLNGVMMGLTPDEARKCFDAVIEFAELEDFTQLKLKNYSSGMRVRLGFAVMVQVHADVLLIDEVLAVGDAAFREKCNRVFRELRKEGTTIVLVTHSMPYISQNCDRAMLIEDGRIDAIGNAEDVAARYTELNFARDVRRAAREPVATAPADAEQTPAVITEARIEGDVGLRPGQPIAFHAELEARQELDGASFGLEIWNAGGAKLLAPAPTSLAEGGQVAAGERLRVRAVIENRLAPGRYRLNCGVSHQTQGGAQMPISEVRSIDFQIPGRGRRGALTDLGCEVHIEPAVRPRAAIRR